MNIAPGSIFTILHFLQNLPLAPISLSVVTVARLSRLSKWHALAYCAHSWVTKKMKFCEYCPRVHIHNTSFLQNLWLSPISLSLCSVASLSRLSKWHTLAYCALSWVRKKMKSFEYCPRVHIHNTSFSSKRTDGSNKLEYLFRCKPFQAIEMTHSSLLGSFLSYE